MKRKMRDITKQTSIVINTLASIEIILSLNRTTRSLNRKQKSFRKKRDSVTNSCQSRDMTKREFLNEEEY
jgi:hypothetical protein